jgi:hypothetical protein
VFVGHPVERYQGFEGLTIPRLAAVSRLQISSTPAVLGNRSGKPLASSKRSLFVLAITYIFLLWILSSAVSRGQGFAVFLLGMGTFGVGLIAFRLGRRRLLYLIFAVTLLSTVLAIALEILLHLAPGVLKGQVANVSYTGYHWQKGGIYRLDPHMGPDMKPNVHREMYWAGHWWQHDANEDGYRGPALDRADAILLGDSMIYGHGVETSQTVSSRLAEMTGLAVANLGQQGNCMVQCLITLQRKGVPLQPRVIYVSSHFTDLGEATQWYPPEELSRFVASPDANLYLPLAREEYRPKPWWDPFYIWAYHIAIPMRCAGILGAVVRSLRSGALFSETHSESKGPYLPSEEALTSPFVPETDSATETDRLQWQVHRRALEEIQRISDTIGAKTVFFDLGYPYAFSQAIERLAGEMGVEYNAAGRVALEHALAGENIYLANDGHWTAAGCRIVAEELAKSLP